MSHSHRHDPCSPNSGDALVHPEILGPLMTVVYTVATLGQGDDASHAHRTARYEEIMEACLKRLSCYSLELPDRHLPSFLAKRIPYKIALV